ncbi:UvrD-helicase domain-containing protein [Cytobacillus gottheilii]|uniref:DNA 3'-5' helicase n=1 Tax=Cytobacillus gottheilii TaxID=859144 RepID=A0ABX8FFV4_9BACI|nr:ATP-dependent helicase [Cytobacillus gottheilii]QVY62916.1 UvrD-helicase domain-containing protein [Cytobacillus gottheilii]
MKTALFNERIIQIDQVAREELVSISNQAKQGQLTCPVCGEKVRLYLGIYKQPHFYHYSNTAKECEDQLQAASSIDESAASVEINGFTLPQSRSITAEPSAVTGFKEAYEIKTGTEMLQQPKSAIHSNAFLEQLSKTGTALDPKQAEAVCFDEGPLLVLAGAGSGKTRVLTARAAYLIQEKQVSPNQLMLVTFTSKAAAEMKARLLTFPSMNKSSIGQMVTGTFHSIFFRILSFHERDIWSGDSLLAKEWQKEQILKMAGREMNLDEKDFSYDLALQQISYWKNSLQTPQSASAENDWEKTVKDLFRKYEQYKAEKQLFDFDDMLTGCYRLFTENPDLAQRYQERFHHILIDEFQDINTVQYELIKILSAKHKNVFAVGDDDQSIYAFRGSSPHFLLHFEKDYPQANVISLSQNYRSSHEVVSAANEVIKLNKERRLKKMNAQYKSLVSPIAFFPYDEEEEAAMIFTDIGEKLEGAFKPEDIAILYRTHAGSRAIFEKLAYSSFPFKIDQDAESFYDKFIIKSMLGFLKLSIDEEDQEAVKLILPALFMKNQILQDMKANSILNDMTLLECFAHVKTGYSFQEAKLKKVVPVIRSLKGLSPLRAIEIVEKELGYSDFIKKRGNEGNKLEKGSDELKDLKVAAKRFKHISDFLEHADHIRAMNKEIKKQNRTLENAITLSTIHRSKGLEYKAVYILGAVDGSLPHDHALEAYRNGDSLPLEEERRLLYVAMTRAQSSLAISVPQNRRGKRANTSRFLTSLLKKSR